MFLLQFLLLIAGGVLLSNLLIDSEHKIEKLTLGFLLNLGIFTFLWFATNSLGIAYTKYSALAVLVILFILFASFNLSLKMSSRFEILKIKVSDFGKFNILEKIILTLIGLLIASSFVNNLYWPVKAWDSLALYDFRSIVFTKTGFMTQGIELGYFFQYPLFTSLFHTWARVNGINNPMFFYSLLYLSLLSSFYFSLRKGINKTLSLFWTFVVGTLPLIFEHSSIAYTNLPYSIAIILSIIYFDRYIKHNSRGLALASSLLLSISMWTRYTEPFWMGILFFVSIYLLYRKKIVLLASYLLLFFVSKYLWVNYLSSIGLNDFSTANAPIDIVGIVRSISIGRIYEITKFINTNIFLSWGAILPIFLLVLIRNIYAKSKNSNLLLGLHLLVLLAILLGGTYLFSFVFSGWSDIPDSATRMAMFFPPLFIYYIGLETANLKYEK